MRSGVSALAGSVRRRAAWFVRDRFPHRRVTRDVQGVRLVLPWSHRLPDYAGPGSIYGQNLVELARLLAKAAPPLTVIDVGANVGDSALQILNATDGRVLCIEADSAYLEYLHLNADSDPRVSIVEALLVVDEKQAAQSAVRVGGTTRFTDSAAGDSQPSVTPAALREQYPDFADLRLVKSDTDGYDTTLVPAIAAQWADSRPVLFFEYDPYLIRLANKDPLAVWPQLRELGYEHVAVWDHGGNALGRISTADVGSRIGVLDDFPPSRPMSRSYWDVAVVHADDLPGQAVLDELIAPERGL